MPTIWTPKDQAALDAARAQTAALEAQRNTSNSEVLKGIDEIVEKHKYHEMDLATLKQWLLNNRWALVDILTQGEFGKMLALQEMSFNIEISNGNPPPRLTLPAHPHGA